MKIVIPGGSGQVGTLLTRAFQRDGHDVVILSRRSKVSAACRVVEWDAERVGDWVAELDGADVVINLAGLSVNCRYGKRNRRLIMDSRVNSTRVIGEGISRCDVPPRVWLQASTATIYSHRYDAPNDELSGILGGSEADVPETWKFSIDVATAWEQAALDANVPGTRQVLLRSAMTMSPDCGGVFDVLRRLTLRGLGGTIGDGRQYVSWIHERDFLNAIYWLIDREEFDGAVNLASPNPLPYAEFMRHLRIACGVRFGLPARRWMVEVGTFLMRTESELILKSRRVVPRRLLDAGFRFQFPDWVDAASELCLRKGPADAMRNRD
jgi:uncharacterized protein (TIGR01777 family)